MGVNTDLARSFRDPLHDSRLVKGQLADFCTRWINSGTLVNADPAILILFNLLISGEKVSF